MVRKLPAEGLVTVTLTTAAVALAGTPAWPVTWTFSTPPAPGALPEHWLAGEAVEAERVSQIRAGVTEWYAMGAGGEGDGEGDDDGDEDGAGAGGVEDQYPIVG